MINIYSRKDIETFKQGGRILASILDQLSRETKEGVSGRWLDERARKLIQKAGAEPSFLNYRNFPAVLCVSVNEELVHGIPKNEPFREGDLVGLDLGIRWKGLCLDRAITVGIGQIDEEKERFLAAVKKALTLGIGQAREGNYLGAISSIIEKTLKENNYGVVTALSGHGLGKKVHEEPSVPNFGSKNMKPVLKAGMVLAIEPMACLGSGKVKTAQDGFTIVSADNSLTAHFEETIIIGKKPIILTRI